MTSTINKLIGTKTTTCDKVQTTTKDKNNNTIYHNTATPLQKIKHNNNMNNMNNMNYPEINLKLVRAKKNFNTTLANEKLPKLTNAEWKKMLLALVAWFQTNDDLKLPAGIPAGVITAKYTSILDPLPFRGFRRTVNQFMSELAKQGLLENCGTTGKNGLVLKIKGIERKYSNKAVLYTNTFLNASTIAAFRKEISLLSTPVGRAPRINTGGVSVKLLSPTVLLPTVARGLDYIAWQRAVPYNKETYPSLTVEERRQKKSADYAAYQKAQSSGITKITYIQWQQVVGPYDKKTYPSLNVEERRQKKSADYKLYKAI